MTPLRAVAVGVGDGREVIVAVIFVAHQQYGVALPVRFFRLGQAVERVVAVGGGVVAPVGFGELV